MSETENALFDFDGLGEYDLEEDANDLAERIRAKERKRIQDIVDAHEDNEPALIDALCEGFGWFGPYFEDNSYQTIAKYMNMHEDDFSVQEAVEKIAAPIEQLVHEGKEEFVGWLLDLWFGILQTAKRTPAHQQARLVQLFKAIKARPDPNPPAKPIWSELWDFDSCATEASNDTPNRRHEWTPIAAIHAHTNVSSFMAQLTYERVVENWYWNPRRALYEALERDNSSLDLDRYVPAAAVWVRLFGQSLKDEKYLDSDSDFYHESRGTGWQYWKKRFEEVARNDEVNQETRSVAEEMVVLMSSIDCADASEVSEASGDKQTSNGQ